MRAFKTATFPSTEVLVIGASPAGSARARVLASPGVDVLLVDNTPRAATRPAATG